MRPSIASCAAVAVSALALAPAPSLAQRGEPAAAAPPAAAPAPPTRVGFRAAIDGDVYTVTVDGKQELACQTPCELTLSPGAHDVRVTGSSRFAQRIDLTGPTSLQVERRRMGRMVLGIVSLAVGVPVALVGLELILLANLDANENPPAMTSGERRSLRQAGSLMVAGGTVLALVGGISGFTTMGRTRLAPDASGRVSQERADTGLRLAGLGAAPARGGGMLTVAFSF